MAALAPAASISQGGLLRRTCAHLQQVQGASDRLST